MQELISLGFGLLVGGFVGFNYGVKRVADHAAEAAHDLLEAMRERFGSTVRRTVRRPVTVEGGEWYDTAEAEFLELPEDIEVLGDKLFNLR